MKHIRYILLLAVLIGFAAITAQARDYIRPNDYIRPPQCHKAGHSCVLKMDDNRPFWCMKLTTQRYKDARRAIRSPLARVCKARFAAYLKPTPKTNQEE